jgi:hypothetical protein
MLVALLLVAACHTGGVYSTPMPNADPSGELHHFFWDFRCRFGPAAAQTRDLRIDIDLSPLKGGIQDTIIVAVFEDAGYTVEQPVMYGPYQTVPRIDWPADAPATVRAFTYPGTGIQLTAGLKADETPVAFGGVSLLCNSEPGAPDSVSLIAQQLEAQIVTAAFARRGFRVRVGKKPHDGFVR